MTDTYEGALEALLHSPLHQSRSKEALAKAAARRKDTISDMKTYMERSNLVDDVPTNIQILHITGTKGKGSTSSMCESILRRHYHFNTGLFTSPHLVDIRERIRVNGLPVSKAVFAKAYWTLRHRLEQYNKGNTEDNDNDSSLPVLPGYFRMLTLMALFVFAHYEQPPLDVIILEVGMGGRYDATNILDMTNRRKVVCGITLLDYDHCRVLGDTLEEIAWEKGGIFQAMKGSSGKSNSNNTEESPPPPSPSSFPTLFAIDSNTPGVLSVLEQCAKEESMGRTFQIVGDRTGVVPKDAVLGLQGDHQWINAELAVHLCDAIVKLKQNGASNNNDDVKKRKLQQEEEGILQALAMASWPGRCQTVQLTRKDGNDNQKPHIYLRLDGAHTPISLQAGFQWFCKVNNNNNNKQGDSDSTTTTTKILIFNTSHERNPVELLQIMLRPTTSNKNGDSIVQFDKVYFCRSDVERPSAETKKSAQDLLEREGIPIKTELLPKEEKKEDAGGATTIVTWQRTLESIWKHLEASTTSASSTSTAVTAANMSVKEALAEIEDMSSNDDTDTVEKVEVFLTGSLLLVGSALAAIGWSERDADGDLNKLS